ncbi:site-specific integrase [Nocardiopsis sp. HNM0947]|uniref:Site-specific integrase n=1 Tax=Nocardiopsis coralli TaxID=2772213 RepID=A0ABR9P8M7_9ACTN|nr:tyrosine-type recombinase/integrase [Nocardiopsis coralli]MBE3000198.1 site-specific integrase [Nocardiopsis coralli]
MPVVDTWHKTVKQPDGSKVEERSAAYGRGKRWAARYRDDNGNQKSPKFKTKAAAEAHLKRAEGDLQRGQYVDPKAGDVKLRDFAEEVLSNASLDESSRDEMRRRLRRHVFPELGGKAMRAVRPSMVQAWLRGRLDQLGEQTVKTVFQNLSMVFQVAVDDEIIGRNPCRSGSVKAPTVPRRKVEPWSVERVAAIMTALPSYCRAVVAPGAGCGMRQGEVFGLAADDVEFLHRNVIVRRQIKMVRNRWVFAPPKGGKERDVPLPRHVADVLSQHIADRPPVEVTLPWREPGGSPVTARLIFTTRRGKHLNKTTFNAYVWKPALVEVGVLPRPAEGQRIPAAHDKGFHQLRHHYASLTLDEGVSIRALAEYLGHSDPGFTLRTYAHMMPSSDGRARDAIDRAWSANTPPASAPDVRPDGTDGGGHTP